MKVLFDNKRTSSTLFSPIVLILMLILSSIFLNGCFNSDDPILNKANEKFDLGYYRSAINDFNKLIETKPDNEEAHLYRGLSYYYLDIIDSAKIDLNVAAASSTAKIKCKALNYLGWISLEIEKDTSTALSIFTYAKNTYESDGSKEMPFVARIYYALGKINYISMKSVTYKSDEYNSYREEAIKNFNQAIVLDKYNEWGFWGRGLVHYSDGFYDSAYTDMNMAIILYHKFSSAYYYRALCEKKLKGNQQAICDDYKKAIKYEEEEGEKIIDSVGLGEGCK
jgi:tetratricopeptide (TPR) repeat protein